MGPAWVSMNGLKKIVSGFAIFTTLRRRLGKLSFQHFSQDISQEGNGGAATSAVAGGRPFQRGNLRLDWCVPFKTRDENTSSRERPEHDEPCESNFDGVACVRHLE